MGNVDLYDASDVFVSTHSTIQAAVNAASSNYKVRIGASGSPYYENVSVSSKTGLTIEPKTGESVTVSGAISALATSPSGQWTFHATVLGRSVYKRSNTYNYNLGGAQGAYFSSDTRLYSYSTYANLTAFASGEGLFMDNAADLLYIILGASGTTNPNTVALRISASDYTFLLSSSSGCTIQNLQIEIAGEGCVKFQSSDNNTISNCTLKIAKWGVYFRNDGGGCSGNIIEDCIIIDSRKPAWTWDEIKHSLLEGSGIKMACGGLANIYRRNEIYGFFNGINNNKSDNSTPYLDGTLIYENVIHDIFDDALEIEDYCRNVQVYLNEVYDAFNGLSSTPMYDGPIYYYRNKITCDKDSNGLGRCWKGSDTHTRNKVYVYHNTFTANGNIWPYPNTTASEMTNIKFYNNIALVAANKFAINGSAFHTQTGNIFDGNIYHRISGGGNLFKDFDKNDGTQRATLAAFVASAEGVASGWEANGQEGDPLVDMSSYPYPFELLSDSSIAIDAGVALPGSFPDNTPYAGDLTVGWKPFSGDPGIPVKLTGLARAAVNTATGNQTFRDSHMTATPTAAIFIMTAATSDGTAANGILYSVGFAVSSSARLALSAYESDNVSTTATRRRTVEDGCIVFTDSAGTIVAEADFVQFEADAGAGAGATINWTNAPESAFLLTVILFAATNAAAGSYLTPASNGGTVSPSIGFQAELIFFLAGAGAIPGTTAGITNSFGLAVGNLTQRCQALRSANAQGAATLEAQFLDNRVSARLQSGGTVLNATELTAISGTGFTCTQRVGSGGTDEVAYLALAFSSPLLWLGDTDTPTATGLKTITSPNFYPQLLILGLTNTEAANTAYTDGRAGSMGIGTVTSYASYSNTWSSDDAASPTVARSLSDDTAINLTNDDGSSQNVAAFSQFTTAGWQLNHTAVAATAKKVWALAIEGPQEAVIGGIPPLFGNYRRMRTR